MTDVVIRDDAPVSPPVRQPETVVRDEGDPRVVRDQFGRPRVKGIRTDIVHSRFLAGDSIELLADDYDDFTVDDVQACIDVEERLAARREAKKAKRKDPIRRQLKANGRACRNRGRDFEKYVEARLAAFGFKRVPGSGMFGGNLSGDLRRERLERVKACARCLEGTDVVEPAMLIECKRQEAEQRFFRRALAQGGGSHAVVVGKKGVEPLVVMELAAFEALLRQADYEVTG